MEGFYHVGRGAGGGRGCNVGLPSGRVEEISGGTSCGTTFGEGTHLNVEGVYHWRDYRYAKGVQPVLAYHARCLSGDVCVESWQGESALYYLRED